ncbi:hypothetical protein [Haladaptatus halobius]|uniref:hypothetical protein n=1 Tax=Haladaptatus halobius TaxID=2884875 RepID=UPI001D0A85C6|nr:hypothetical protein [Haladaptatus halobius]
MNRDEYVRHATRQFFIAAVLVIAANLVSGALFASFGGNPVGTVVGLGLYLVVLLPALYYALLLVAKGLWIIAEGFVHAARDTSDVPQDF